MISDEKDITSVHFHIFFDKGNYLFMESAKDHSDENGVVFNIQRFSLRDGPGIRTTVFMKGCPLKCLWCSNPESQNMAPELVLFAERGNQDDQDRPEGDKLANMRPVSVVC